MKHSLRLIIDVEQAGNNDDHEHSLRVSGLLRRIMTTPCSSLPQLTAFGVDLINFPLDSYAYFRRHFAAQHHFLTLRALRIFVCKESIDEANLDALLTFLRSHGHQRRHLRQPRAARAPAQQDFDLSRFRVTEADAAALDACCRRIIDELSASPRRAPFR